MGAFRMAKLTVTAFILCQLVAAASADEARSYRSVWADDLAKQWAKEGVKPSQDQDYFDCLVNETMASFTPAELGRLDVFVSTMNPDLQSEANAIVANRDGRIGNDLARYLSGKCSGLKG